MIMENDNFCIPKKMMCMSIAELEKAQDKKYRELLTKKVQNRGLSKKKTKPCTVSFNF